MEDYIEVRMPSDNPWIKGPLVKVDRALATRIAEVATATAESYRGKFNTGWMYDKPVFKAVVDMWPEDDYEREAMFRAVQIVLSQDVNYSDWHDGKYAAYRCFKTRNAYATPGFVAAKRYSEMMGT